MALRVAAGVLLCLGAAQAEGGLKGLLHWLEKNGPELVDTAAHCVDAAEKVKELSHKCPTRTFDPEGMAGLAAWGVLEGLENMQMPMAHKLVNSSFAHYVKEGAIRMVQDMTHRSVQEFCGRSECQSAMTQFEVSYFKCYSAAICATSLSSEIPLDHCKQTMGTFLMQMMRLEQGMMCSKESMHDFYCAEESTGLLLESPTCYVRFVTPVLEGERACEADCVNLWKRAQAQHPRCSTFLQRQSTASQQMTMHFIRELARGATDPNMRKAVELLPKNVQSFQQVCMGSPTFQV